MGSRLSPTRPTISPQPPPPDRSGHHQKLAIAHSNELVSTERQYDEIAADHVGAMLVPERQVPGEPAVRTDARFHLRRTIDEGSLGEAKRHQLAIILAVAKPGKPSGHL